MKIVALVSGGKDGIYAIKKCLDYGHEVVVLANLYSSDKDDEDENNNDNENCGKGNEGNEIDSFMFQTVGSNILEGISEAMGIPLERERITGKSVQTSINYNANQNQKENEKDEVEDLYRLIKRIKENYPDVNAVCSGAVLSTYQRNRVENVCSRLGLESISYLWQRDQAEMVREMIEYGMDAILAKVASMGLKEKYLGKSIKDMLPIFNKLNKEFGFHTAGEGGEYETIVLDCPLYRHGRIVIDDFSIVQHENGDDVSYLKINKWHLEKKEKIDVDGNEIVKLNESTAQICNIDSSKKYINQKQAKFMQFGPYFGCEDTSKANVATIMQELLTDLSQINKSFSDVFFVHLYLSDLKEFGNVNEEYCKYFADVTTGSPSRVCVEFSRMHGNAKVSLDALVFASIDKEEEREGAKVAKDDKFVLHVKSMSEWAPMCIGPYSQANLIGRLVFVAGQIAIDPGTMKLISVYGDCINNSSSGTVNLVSNYAILAELELSFRNFERVLEDHHIGCFQSRNYNRDVIDREQAILGGVIYVDGVKVSKDCVNEYIIPWVQSRYPKCVFTFVMTSGLPRGACVEVEAIGMKPLRSGPKTTQYMYSQSHVNLFVDDTDSDELEEGYGNNNNNNLKFCKIETISKMEKENNRIGCASVHVKFDVVENNDEDKQAIQTAIVSSLTGLVDILSSKTTGDDIIQARLYNNSSLDITRCIKSISSNKESETRIIISNEQNIMKTSSISEISMFLLKFPSN